MGRARVHMNTIVQERTLQWGSDVLLMPLLVPAPPLYLSAPGLKGCSAVTLAKCPLTRCPVPCGGAVEGPELLEIHVSVHF